MGHPPFGVVTLFYEGLDADETLLRGMGFPADWQSLALWQ